MINLGGKKVAKLLVGSSVIYQDNGGWQQLKVLSPDGGNVWFKDNGDGTASLVGNVGISIRKSAAVTVDLFKAPEGYAFTSLDWNVSLGSDITFIKQVYAYGNIIGYDYAKVSILDGTLQASYSANQSLSSDPTRGIITFSRATTYRTQDFAMFAQPAIIGIEKL